MATWITHLRIADKLFGKMADLTPAQFIVGNMAPDSGVPNADWSIFTPNTEISHWRKIGADGVKRIYIDEYAEKYLSYEKRKTYDKEQYSFYLGYMSHLYADIYWADSARGQFEALIKDSFEKDKNECMRKLKRDWYDLDFLYLKENGLFGAFRIYKDAEGFQNRYLDFFSVEAFDNRREYITDHYLSGKDGVDREYPYFNKDEMEKFVTESAGRIIKILSSEYGITAMI